jgi:hypothetical protein
MRLAGFVLVATVLLMFECSSLSKNEHSKTDCHSYGYWESVRGYNWYLGKDSTFREYTSHGGKREWISADDIIFGWEHWEFRNDTIFIGSTREKYYRSYPVVKWDKKYLQVVDPRKVWGVDTLHFFLANDQKTIPTE